MTCIIGLEEDGKAYIGADSASTNSNFEQWITLIPKVFSNGDLTIGYTSSFRMGQLLQYAKFPKPANGIYNHKWIVVDLIEFIRKEFKEKAFSEVKDNQETGGKFLIGVQNKIYEIDDDYQVQKYAFGIYTIGIGDEFARGAMMALKDKPPKKRIEVSLQIAAELSAGVAPPFKIVEVK